MRSEFGPPDMSKETSSDGDIADFPGCYDIENTVERIQLAMFGLKEIVMVISSRERAGNRGRKALPYRDDRFGSHRR